MPRVADLEEVGQDRNLTPSLLSALPPSCDSQPPAPLSSVPLLQFELE